MSAEKTGYLLGYVIGFIVVSFLGTLVIAVGIKLMRWALS